MLAHHDTTQPITEAGIGDLQAALEHAAHRLGGRDPGAVITTTPGLVQFLRPEAQQLPNSSKLTFPGSDFVNLTSELFTYAMTCRDAAAGIARVAERGQVESARRDTLRYSAAADIGMVVLELTEGLWVPASVFGDLQRKISDFVDKGALPREVSSSDPFVIEGARSILGWLWDTAAGADE